MCITRTFNLHPLCQLTTYIVLKITTNTEIDIEDLYRNIDHIKNKQYNVEIIFYPWGINLRGFCGI